VPTVAGGEGVCQPLTERFADGGMDYQAFIGGVAQTVAVDVAALARAIARLADDPALRRRMGQAGQRRARGQFDWSVVMQRYRALWRAQAERRSAATPGPVERWPARPDPGRAFAAWPSQVLSTTSRVRRVAAPPTDLAALLASPLVAYEGAILPRRRDLERVLAAASGWVSVSDLTGTEPPAVIQRTVLWLAKYGLLEVVANRPHSAKNRSVS
jgi:hypothetical protein